MAAQTDPEIVLYDLTSTKDVCFSPVVWRIRLMLNYKSIPYKIIFLEFPDIEPTLKELGVIPAESAGGKYTVPTIHHVPTNTYIMDSAAIAEFLESTYPDRPVTLTSELGSEIMAKSRTALGPVITTSVAPRELLILSPRAQDYFRRTREARLGCRLEDLLLKEDEGWEKAEQALGEVGALLRTHRAEGPFVLGARPSYVDFFTAGNLLAAKAVDEGIFERIVKHPGYREVYEACLPFVERQT